MTSRYEGRAIGVNVTDRYRDILRKRRINSLRQYLTQTLEFPTLEEYGNLQLAYHIWKEGDRFFKLAHQYYGCLLYTSPSPRDS